MRTVALLLVCACAASPAADKPKMHIAMLQAMEQSMDKRLNNLWPNDPVPVEVIGVPHGAYINGYGAVFTLQFNLAQTAGISPFHPAITKDEIVRVHQKKLERMPRLREAMQEILLSSAASLDAVPPEDQIALAITLFYFNGESTAGLPNQIVMHAQRKLLVDVQSGRANRALLASAVNTDEF